MCGIAALYKFQRNQCQIRNGLGHELNAMIDCIAHRGPDGKGLFVDENEVGLGMCRLAIVDAATGDQPICKFL
jgi:asparagine synthase (glutamine-hydrolysing)